MNSTTPLCGASLSSALRGLAGVAACVAATALVPITAQAQATIYRCHSLDGQLIFQDKPCDQVPGTQEARKGSAGEVVPNAPPAPAVEGPPLAERYENYLDSQSARRAAEAGAQPPPTPAVESAGVRQSSGGESPVPATSPYSGYEEGYYPYPLYPSYPYREQPGNNGTAATAPIYNRGGLLPPPTIMQEPSLTPQKPPPRSSTPAHVVPKDPNR